MMQEQKVGQMLIEELLEDDVQLPKSVTVPEQIVAAMSI
jgi:hypothetical protein